MKSVPPGVSGWVIDSEFVTAEIQASGRVPESERKTYRYREVVLTSQDRGLSFRAEVAV